jgi:hypothetical protein
MKLLQLLMRIEFETGGTVWRARRTGKVNATSRSSLHVCHANRLEGLKKFMTILRSSLKVPDASRYSNMVAYVKFEILTAFRSNMSALLAICFHAGFLLGVFFDREDEGDMFFLNVA